MALDVFLSHSSGDADVARELRGVLEAAGYRCWMAPDDVTGTESWAEQILGAIEASRAMIVLISSNANKSPHVSREVNLAIGRKRPVFPIRIENVPPEASLEYLLSLMQRIDAFPLPISDHRDRILRRLGAVVPVVPPVAPPAEPTTEHMPAPDASTATAPPVPIPPSEGAPQPATVPAPVQAPVPGPVGPGSTIGGFAIDSVLGEGGMATVYRATQQEPKRAVALKLIRADHAADPTYRQRFLSEKDTLATLEHPSIVPIYAAGDADGVLFIAMRLVDGPDLASRLAKEGRLSLRETVVTLRPIADAIDYAHEMGVIHRDLKPSNVILDRRGRPYLTDFGLGKHVDRPRDLSVPGVAVGTLDYMAPEQFSGIVDPALAGRTDVYALGCVAFACLTGAPPFRADEPERVMYGHLHGAVPNLRELRPDLPAAVDAAIRRALAKNPADRYPTADAFLEDLAGAESLTEERTAAIVPPPRIAAGGLGGWIRTHALMAGAAGTAIALIVVGTAAFAGAGPASSSSPRPNGSQAAIATPDASGGAPTAGETSVLPTPTLEPTPQPTPSPTPQPTPDELPPTNVGISITAATVYTPTVDVNLTASGAAEMRLGNAASANGTCTWGSWQPYTRNVSNWSLGTTTAGTRWVCAKFRDAAHNESTARDSVYFDHRPVDEGHLFDYSDTGSNRLETCDLIKQYHGFNITLIPKIATDPDAGDSITVSDVKQGSTSYTITGNGTAVNIYFGPPYSNFLKGTYSFSYKAVDEHGGTVSGTFMVAIGPCPA